MVTSSGYEPEHEQPESAQIVHLRMPWFITVRLRVPWFITVRLHGPWFITVMNQGTSSHWQHRATGRSSLESRVSLSDYPGSTGTLRLDYTTDAVSRSIVGQ